MDIRPAAAIVALVFEHGFGVQRVWAGLWPLSVTMNGAGSVVTWPLEPLVSSSINWDYCENQMQLCIYKSFEY